MVDNFISEKKMEAEQEARLYVMILELQEKWEDILKFIESMLYTYLIRTRRQRWHTNDLVKLAGVRLSLWRSFGVAYVQQWTSFHYHIVIGAHL